MPHQVRLIVNPSAGGGRGARALPAVKIALGTAGLVVRDALTRDLGDARRIALDAAQAGETVVTLGGDGLIGAVADVLRSHPDTVMGILPGGRGNDLVRTLGIPRDPVAACAVIATGRPRTIDLGEVNGRAFVSIASAGFDSVANRIANAAPGARGASVYGYGRLRALATWTPVQMDIELDPPGPTQSFSACTVAAANSGVYGGGMRLAPDASLSDGLLDVVVIGATSRWRYLRDAPKVFSGQHVHLDYVHIVRAAEVRISAERAFDVYADGDPIAPLPARVRTLPAAIRVLVPHDSAAADPVASPPSASAVPR